MNPTLQDQIKDYQTIGLPAQKYDDSDILVTVWERRGDKTMVEISISYTLGIGRS